MPIIGVGYNPTKREVLGNQEFVKGGIKEGGIDCNICSFEHERCSNIDCFDGEKVWAWIKVKSRLSVNKENVTK